MYNIILIDGLGFLIESILKNTDWHITLLIVRNNVTKQRYLGNPRIDKIYHSTEFMQIESAENIDFEFYKQFEKHYRTVDSGLRRLKYDYQFARYHFFMGLSVWREILKKTRVDFCLYSALEHGIVEDTIPMKVAAYFGIEFYSVIQINRNMCVVYDHLNDVMLQRRNIASEQLITKLLYKDAYYFKNVKTCSKGKKTFKQFLGSIAFNKIGNLAYVLYDCLQNRSLNFKWYEDRRIETNLLYYLDCFAKWKFIQYKNQKRSVSVDYSKKYVVYFLHFEPEAVVVNYSNHMDSQLINIKMLAKSLPKDWVMYVKEHPIARKLNSTKGYAHFIEFYCKYNSDWYWNEICKIKNVFLADINESATKLIKNSQAVSTIAGTVIEEAIIEKKPCIIFSNPKKNIFSKCDNVYAVSSFSECKEVINKIKSTDFVCNEEKISNLTPYIMPNTVEGHAYALKMIREDVEAKKNSNINLL